MPSRAPFRHQPFCDSVAKSYVPWPPSPRASICTSSTLGSLCLMRASVAPPAPLATSASWPLSGCESLARPSGARRCCFVITCQLSLVSCCPTRQVCLAQHCYISVYPAAQDQLLPCCKHLHTAQGKSAPLVSRLCLAPQPTFGHT